MGDPPKGVILIVDHQPLERIHLNVDLSDAGYEVQEAPDAAAAMRILGTRPIDVLIAEARPPDLDGLQLLGGVKSQSPHTHVILMSAANSLAAAVEAVKHGAYDYLAKPLTADVLLDRLNRLRLARGPSSPFTSTRVEKLGRLVGRSYASRCLFDQVRRAADHDGPVLIHGEPGTGKDLVAETIHGLSRRANRPFERVPCAGRPSAPFEAQLFGGPTGDDGSCVGLFERADGGTVLFDEVHALPLDLQYKLFRALESGTVQRYGGGPGVPVDVRVLCTTHRNLDEHVAIGRFRADLLSHLNRVTLQIPPLRDRPEDAAVLARHFLQLRDAGDDGRHKPLAITPHAIDLLTGHDWPGNVRELRRTLEQAAALAVGRDVEPRDIILPAKPRPRASLAGGGVIADLSETVVGVAKALIDAAHRQAAGNQARAAQLLKIPRTTLRDKMQKYGMDAGLVRKPRR